MARKYQNGSTAHIALVVVVVVALLGALGYVFWKNYQDTGDKNDVTTTAPSPSADAANTKEFCLTNEKACFDIPEDWTASNTDVTMPGMPSADEATVKNGDKTVLSIQSGVGAVGGVCPTPDKTVNVIAVEKTDARIPSAQNTDTDSTYNTENGAIVVSAVKAVVQDAKGFYPVAFLSAQKDVTKPQVIQTCRPELLTVYPTKNTGDMNMSAASFKIMTSQPVTYPYLDSKEKAEAAFNSGDLNAAYEALKSVRYKE